MPEILTTDEAQVLSEYRRAVQLKHADIQLSVKHGRLMKLWFTEKHNLENQAASPRNGKEN